MCSKYQGLWASTYNNNNLVNAFLFPLVTYKIEMFEKLHTNRSTFIITLVLGVLKCYIFLLMPETGLRRAGNCSRGILIIHYITSVYSYVQPMRMLVFYITQKLFK